MPGCIVSAITAGFRSVEKRRRRATPVITSTFENVSDIGVRPGQCLGPPAKAGVRLKRGALYPALPMPVLGHYEGDFDVVALDVCNSFMVADSCPPMEKMTRGQPSGGIGQFGRGSRHG